MNVHVRYTVALPPGYVQELAAQFGMDPTDLDEDYLRHFMKMNGIHGLTDALEDESGERRTVREVEEDA